MSKHTRGFTLIELLVVISIIAILSSVIFSAIASARMKSRDARRISDLNSIRAALELYYDENTSYPHGSIGGDDMDPANYGVSTLGLDTDGYDNNQMSSGSLGPLLSAPLRPYVTAIPADPINTGVFVYRYGYVGKNLFPHQYTLQAYLETPNHPQSCAKTQFQKNAYRWVNYCIDTRIYSASI